MPDNIKSVLDRARDMATCKVRTEGKWAAGFYFNSALFRIDAVYHRVIETVAGTSNEKFEKLLASVDTRFNQWRGCSWERKKLEVINKEMIRLKHRETGIIAGRKVTLEEAVESIRELLTLLEAFDSHASSPTGT